MDADLCRRAGRAKNTPYYRYVGQNAATFDEQFTQVLLEAGTFENLNPATQQFLQLCERSYDLAQDMGMTDLVNPDNLQQIIDRLIAEQPFDEIEEIEVE
jgi:hypothetical protein